MADERPNPWVSLAQSRKTIIAVGSLVMATIVVVVGMLVKADKEYVIALMTAIGALAFKQVGAIATEDAAKTAAVATLDAAKTTAVATRDAARIASQRPPAMDVPPVTFSILPADGTPCETTTGEP